MGEHLQIERCFDRSWVKQQMNSDRNYEETAGGFEKNLNNQSQRTNLEDCASRSYFPFLEALQVWGGSIWMSVLPDFLNFVANMRRNYFICIILKPTQTKGQRVRVLKMTRIFVLHFSVLKTLPESVSVRAQAPKTSRANGVSWQTSSKCSGAPEGAKSYAPVFRWVFNPPTHDIFSKQCCHTGTLVQQVTWIDATHAHPFFCFWQTRSNCWHR